MGRSPPSRPDVVVVSASLATVSPPPAGAMRGTHDRVADHRGSRLGGCPQRLHTVAPARVSPPQMVVVQVTRSTATHKEQE